VVAELKQILERRAGMHAMRPLDFAGIAQLGRLDAPNANMRPQADAVDRVAVDLVGLPSECLDKSSCQLAHSAGVEERIERPCGLPRGGRQSLPCTATLFTANSQGTQYLACLVDKTTR